MLKGILIAVFLIFTLSGEETSATDCCGSYTDPLGTYHESEICASYCCLNVGVNYKVCCNDASRQIPATKNENEDCVRSWIKEHIWVAIVGGIVGFVILISLVTCCCCCCCGCCRKNPRPVIIHTAASPSTTVAMANTTVSQNPAHVGYNQ